MRRRIMICIAGFDSKFHRPRMCPQSLHCCTFAQNKSLKTPSSTPHQCSKDVRDIRCHLHNPWGLCICYLNSTILSTCSCWCRSRPELQTHSRRMLDSYSGLRSSSEICIAKTHCIDLALRSFQNSLLRSSKSPRNSTWNHSHSPRYTLLQL